MEKLKIAYLGSPQIAADFLERLLTDQELNQLVEVKLVITQPDRPAGRRHIITPTPVKVVAQKYKINNLSVNQEISDSKLEKQLNRTAGQLSLINRLTDSLKSVDIALLFAFAKKIPDKFLHLPKYGFWNIHPSLLPQYRGPSPIAYPLLLGDTQTGVTIILMDEQIDHGPILAQEKIKILADDRRLDLEKKLTDLALTLIKKIILRLTARLKQQRYLTADFHLLPAEKQPHHLATYTRLLKKADGYIPLSTLKKALNNQPLTIEEIPLIIKDYFIRNSKSQTLNPKQFQIANYQATTNYQTTKSLEHSNLENSKFFRTSDLKIKNSPEIIYNLFRGLYPWPGLWTRLPKGKRLKIINLTIEQLNNLTIKSVQLEGKTPVDFTTFNRAYRVF